VATIDTIVAGATDHSPSSPRTSRIPPSTAEPALPVSTHPTGRRSGWASDAPVGTPATRRLSRTTLATVVTARATTQATAAHNGTAAVRIRRPRRTTKTNAVVPARLHHV
jgi:hypothetical protein